MGKRDREMENERTRTRTRKFILTPFVIQIKLKIEENMH